MGNAAQAFLKRFLANNLNITLCRMGEVGAKVGSTYLIQVF